MQHKPACSLVPLPPSTHKSKLIIQVCRDRDKDTTMHIPDLDADNYNNWLFFSEKWNVKPRKGRQWDYM